MKRSGAFSRRSPRRKGNGSVGPALVSSACLRRPTFGTSATILAGQRATLDELGSYLDAAQGLVGADLTLMDPSFSGDRGSIAVVRARYEAEVNEYETRYASLLDVA